MLKQVGTKVLRTVGAPIALPALMALWLSSPSYADWVAGVTTDVDTDGVGVVVEHHWPVSWTYGALSGRWGIAGRVDEDRDAFFGAGVTGEYRFAERWYVEMSFMPGLYHRGETDLGGTVHFRTMIGLGVDVSDKIGLGLTIDHMSNGGIQSKNPGSDALMLRIKFRQ